MVFAVFSETTQYFFQVLLFPLEEFLRHFYKKLKLVKSKNFPIKKFRIFFWENIQKLVFFAKILNISRFFSGFFFSPKKRVKPIFSKKIIFSKNFEQKLRKNIKSPKIEVFQISRKLFKIFLAIF